MLKLLVLLGTLVVLNVKSEDVNRSNLNFSEQLNHFKESKVLENLLGPINIQNKHKFGENKLIDERFRKAPISANLELGSDFEHSSDQKQPDVRESTRRNEKMEAFVSREKNQERSKFNRPNQNSGFNINRPSQNSKFDKRRPTNIKRDVEFSTQRAFNFLNNKHQNVEEEFGRSSQNARLENKEKNFESRNIEKPKKENDFANNRRSNEHYFEHEERKFVNENIEQNRNNLRRPSQNFKFEDQKKQKSGFNFVQEEFLNRERGNQNLKFKRNDNNKRSFLNNETATRRLNKRRTSEDLKFKEPTETEAKFNFAPNRRQNEERGNHIKFDTSNRNGRFKEMRFNNNIKRNPELANNEERRSLNQNGPKQENFANQNSPSEHEEKKIVNLKREEMKRQQSNFNFEDNKRQNERFMDRNSKEENLIERRNKNFEFRRDENEKRSFLNKDHETSEANKERLSRGIKTEEQKITRGDFATNGRQNEEKNDKIKFDN